MKMRGGKMVQLHKLVFLSLSTTLLCSFLFVSEASGVPRVRRRSTTTTPHPTTLETTPPAPLLPPQSSARNSSAYSVDSSKSLRVSRFTKRRGQRQQQQQEYTSEEGAQVKQIYATEGPHLVLEREEGLHFALERQPLYEENADYNRMETQRYNQQSFDDKSHYYSPSQVQQQRKRLRQQQGQGQRSGFNQQAPTAPLGYSQNPFPQQPSYPSRFDDHSKPHPEEFHVQPQPQPAPKNYAFAYAVRGDDNNAEDFSHKEARDGKLTMGEYRINLPDGRKQVVRYTAGGKIGYKADVTYEGDADPRNKDMAKATLNQNNVSPAPGPPYFTGTPTGKKSPPRSRNSFNSNDDKEHTPAVGQYRPPKQDRRPRPRPTLTPKSSYSSGGDSDYNQQSPIPPVTFNSGPIRPSSDQEPPYYSSFGGGSGISGGNGPSKRPKSIYDKMPNNGKRKPYNKKETDNLSVLHEQSPRAGPLRSSFYNNNANIEASQSKEEVSSYPHKPASPYDKPFYSSGPSSTSSTGPRSSSGYGNSYSSISHGGPPPGSKSPKPFFKTVSPTPAFIEHEPIGPGPNSAYINFQPSYTTGSGSGFSSSSNGNGGGPGQGLIEDFKAGPTRKNPKNKQYKKPTNKYPSSPDYETKGYQGPSGPSNFHVNSNGNGGGSGFQQYFNSEPQHPFSSPKSFYNSNSNNDYNHNQNTNIRQPPSYSNSPSQIQNHPSPQSYPSFNPIPVGPTPTPAPPGPSPLPRYKEPFHYYNSQHEPYHHGGFTEPNPSEDHPSSVNPTVSAYSVDYPGGGKKSVYFSTKSSSPHKPSKFNRYESAGRKKPTSSGLIYLETPGVGPRPSELGTQETLSRLTNSPGSRHAPGPRNNPGPRNIPPSHHRQSIHPYEVGIADYGKNVGYKNSPADHLQDHHDETEGGAYNGHPPHEQNHYDQGIHGRTHYEDSGNDHPYEGDHPNAYPRDYLSQGEPDRIVSYNAPEVDAPSLVLPPTSDAYPYAANEEDAGISDAVAPASDADVTSANYFESQKTL